LGESAEGETRMSKLCTDNGPKDCGLRQTLELFHHEQHEVSSEWDEQEDELRILYRELFITCRQMSHADLIVLIGMMMRIAYKGVDVSAELLERKRLVS
jgi:hypothetical protein